ADRIDRRVGHFREGLLEKREQELGLVGQRRDRRGVAHGTHPPPPPGSPRRQQGAPNFLGIAEGPLWNGRRENRRPRPPRRGGGGGGRGSLSWWGGLWASCAVSSSWGRRRLWSRSTSNILPGCSRHFVTMSFSGMDRTPISEAMMMRSSRVTK